VALLVVVLDLVVATLSGLLAVLSDAPLFLSDALLQHWYPWPRFFKETEV